MLSRRIAQAPALRSLASRRALPIVQQRTFIPDSINSKRLVDEKYPDALRLSEAEDPGQVRLPTPESPVVKVVVGGTLKS
jgi:NADH dehydrogenase (ubiquinone) 1 beta subcomplex subunit 8